MAYRADIEIAVKGAQELKRLSDQINATSKLVNGLNNYLQNIGTGGVVNNINNLNAAVREAAKALNEAALGTNEATIAARAFTQATQAANAGLQEKLQLLKAVQEEERKGRLSAVGIRETTQYGGPIGPGAASSVALSSQLRGRTEQILAERKGTEELSAVLQDLFEKQRQLENSKLDEKAAKIQVALDAEATAALETALQIDKLSDRQKEFTLRTEEAARAAHALTAAFIRQQRLDIQFKRGKQVSAVELGPGGPGFSGGFTAGQRQIANEEAILRVRREENKIRRENLSIAQREELFELKLRNIRERNLAIEKQRSRTKEATSNAIIGGAFPLLFGQGVGAAVGGGIGGFAGGLAGGQLGFGLSLVGTAVGASFDALIQSSVDFAKSLRQGGDAATYLENTLGYLDPTLKEQIKNLQNSGQNAAAAELAFQELSKTVGKDGAQAFLELGQRTEASTLVLKKLTASFIAAGLSANKFFSDIKFGKGKDFTQFLPQQFRPTQTPQSAAETAAFEQRTAELSKNNDILRLQVQLTALSAKNDLDRFITIQKQIATKQYENELTKISIQLKNREISIEQNKLLITSANLEFSKKLGDIERDRVQELARRQQEVAQAAEENLRAQASIQKSIFDEQLKLVDINIRQQEFAGGEEAGLKRTLELTNAKARITENILNVERDAAIIEAQKTGTVQETLRLYDLRLKNTQFELDLEERITRERLAQINLERFKVAQTAVQTAVQPFQDLRANRELEIQYAKTYQRLVTEGLLPVEAERVANFEKLVTQQTLSIDKEILLTEATLARARALGANTLELERELGLLNQIKGAITAQAAIGPGQIKEQPGSIIQKRITELQGGINELTNLENISITAANNIGQAFGNAFQEIITGASSGQEALANMMRSVGENFVNMAAQIIAQQITMIILGTIMKALGLSMGGGGSNPTAPGGDWTSAVDRLGTSTPGYDMGSIAGGMAPFGRATGGPVTNGTPYVVGERGPELFVPGTGGSVVPTGQLREAMGGGISSGSPVLNMSFETTRFGDTEYVSRDQLEAAMVATRRQAATDGAKRGMSMTLDRIQNSTSTRRKIGI